jgi:hypothetical protein
MDEPRLWATFAKGTVVVESISVALLSHAEVWFTRKRLYGWADAPSFVEWEIRVAQITWAKKSDVSDIDITKECAVHLRDGVLNGIMQPKLAAAHYPTCLLIELHSKQDDYHAQGVFRIFHNPKHAGSIETEP